MYEASHYIFHRINFNQCDVRAVAGWTSPDLSALSEQALNARRLADESLVGKLSKLLGPLPFPCYAKPSPATWGGGVLIDCVHAPLLSSSQPSSKLPRPHQQNPRLEVCTTVAGDFMLHTVQAFFFSYQHIFKGLNSQNHTHTHNGPRRYYCSLNSLGRLCRPRGRMFPHHQARG